MTSYFVQLMKAHAKRVGRCLTLLSKRVGDLSWPLLRREGQGLAVANGGSGKGTTWMEANLVLEPGGMGLAILG